MGLEQHAIREAPKGRDPAVHSRSRSDQPEMTERHLRFPAFQHPLQVDPKSIHRFLEILKCTRLLFRYCRRLFVAKSRSGLPWQQTGTELDSPSAITLRQTLTSDGQDIFNRGTVKRHSPPLGIFVTRLINRGAQRRHFKLLCDLEVLVGLHYSKRPPIFFDGNRSALRIINQSTKSILCIFCRHCFHICRIN